MSVSFATETVNFSETNSKLATTPRSFPPKLMELQLEDIETLSVPLSASEGEFLLNSTGSLIKPIVRDQWECCTPRTKEAMEQLCVKPEQLGFRPLSSFGTDAFAEARFRGTETTRQELTKQLLALCGNMKMPKLIRLTTRISHQPTSLTILPKLTATDLVMKINNLPPPVPQPSHVHIAPTTAPLKSPSLPTIANSSRPTPRSPRYTRGVKFSQSSVARDPEDPAAEHDDDEADPLSLIHHEHEPDRHDELVTRHDPASSARERADLSPPPKPELSQYCLRVLSALPQVRCISTKHHALAQRSREKLEHQVRAMARHHQFTDAARVSALQRLRSKEQEERRRLAERIGQFAQDKLRRVHLREGRNAAREGRLRALAHSAEAQAALLRASYQAKDIRTRARVAAVRTRRDETAAMHASALGQQLAEAAQRRGQRDVDRAHQQAALEAAVEAKATAGMARAQTWRAAREAAMHARTEQHLLRTLQCDNKYTQTCRERSTRLQAQLADASARVSLARAETSEAALQQAVERMHTHERVAAGSQAQACARHEQEAAIARKYATTDARVVSLRSAVLREALDKREAAHHRAERVRHNQSRLAALEQRYLHQVAARVAEGTNRVLLAQAEQALYVSTRQAQTSRLLQPDRGPARLAAAARLSSSSPSTKGSVGPVAARRACAYGPGGSALGPDGKSLHPLSTQRRTALEERRRQSMALVHAYLAEKR